MEATTSCAIVTVVVPVHSGHDMPKGTLRGILAIVGMTADELHRLLS
ncbi:MAG TPA: type II toxin-antitoxin system HicA family toxin [Streptosporangiaceae bacterium]|nr:type II toxin-antitoxin system HicA family toxin [Streptosporangiaceae bacterium]